jgi:autotransporter-associated beta strand protein
MIKKMQITQNFSDVKSWHPSVQLLVALAILCWGSTARAQQSETWVGTNSPYAWTNNLNWVDNSSGVNEQPALLGDSLTFAVSPAAGMAPQNNFFTTITNIVTGVSTNVSPFGIGSITFGTNGFILGGNALQITNGITDNAGANSNAMAMTIGKSQTFANNASTYLPATATTYPTNTESGTINLSTNTLTIGGSAPLFLTGVISSTNGGQLVINNSGVTRLAVANVFGTNAVQITNYFQGAGTFNPAVVTIYTNSYVVAGVSTNYTYVTNTIASTTNGSNVYITNTFGPQNPEAVMVQGGTLQLNNAAALPGGANVGNIYVDNGRLDLNGQSPAINGLDDSGGGSGVVDNASTANTGLYTLTVGNANSNGVYSGVINNSSGTVGLTKTGFGTEILTGGNGYGGPTIINQGTLVLGISAGNAEGSLGANSTTLTIASGAVFDISALNAYGGYVPPGALTVSAGTPTKPYTNFLGSYDPSYGTNYLVTTATNTIITYQTNTDLATYTNVVSTTNIVSQTYSTNSVISVVTADVNGDFTVNGGGAISPITSISPGFATWSINGNMTLDSSRTYPTISPNRINFLLNNTPAPGGGTNDLVIVNGTLSIGDELDFVVTPLTGSLYNGQYTLIESSQYISTSPNDSDSASLVLIAERGITGTFDTSDGKDIKLTASGTATPGNIIWSGGSTSNNWDVHLSKNWKNTNTNDYFYTGDNVIFNDAGYGTINLPLVVDPGSMTFSNNSTSYSFNASTSVYVTGTGGLTKNGGGSVLLQNPNSFTGDVTVNNGTLNLGYYGTGNTYVLYNGVTLGNLIMGGGTINQLALANASPITAFQNLTINPGASAITQASRAANASPRYNISNNVFRVVGGALNFGLAGGNGAGVYFFNTNSYGVNGILGGYATWSLNDWVVANKTGSAGYGAYQTSLNPASWAGSDNVYLSGSPSASLGTSWINSLKLNNSAPVTVNILNGSALTLSSGGVLVPSAGGPYQQVISGGTLLGATNADLILLQQNTAFNSGLVINSVIADNTNAAATQGSGLTKAGSGNVILTGNNTYTGPTYILNGYSGAAGGMLQVGANGTSGSIANSSAIYDYGTLAFNRSDNTSVGAISGTGNLTKLGAGTLTLTANNPLSGLVTISSGTLQLGTGGASGSVSNAASIVDNGNLVFDNNNNVGYQKVISGSGNVVQMGSGNLIMTNAETYSGNTVVSSGSLALAASGSVSNTAGIIIGAGALFDASAVSGGVTLRSATPSEVLAGSGTFNGSVTTAAGTTVSPGTNGVVGTLTISGSLSLNGGNYVFDVGNTGKDLINVGTLNENSGTVVISVNGGPLLNGVYPLIHATSGVVGSASSLGLFGFVQPGQIGVLTNEAGGNLSLLVYSGTIPQVTWAGDGSQNRWDLTSFNWTNNNGAAAVQYVSPDYAVIDDTGSATPAIDITLGVTPTVVTVNSTNLNFTLGSSSGSLGKITGGSSLVKNGTGQVTLQTLNDYLGGTVISAGTVQLGNNTAAAEDGMVGGSGSISISNNATLSVSNFAMETISGPISGGGSLYQMGAGKLILAGNNTAFSGPVYTTNILQVGNGIIGTLGTGSVTNDGKLVFNVGSSTPVTASISGLGSVTNLGMGTVTLGGSNTYAGSTTIAAGTVVVGAANALPVTTVVNLNVGSGVSGILDLNGYSPIVAGLSGANGSSGGGFTPSYVVNNGGGISTLTVNGGTNTFYGVLADNNNSGSGKVALNVVNNGVNAPMLTLAPITNTLGTATLNLNTFSGGLMVSNATVNLGAIVSLGTGGNATAYSGLGNVTLAGTNCPNGNNVYTNGYGGVLFPTGAKSTSPYCYVTVNSLTVPTGQMGTISQPGEGTMTLNSLQGGGTLYCLAGAYVRAAYDGNWSAFTGTVVFASFPANGNIGLNNTAGLPNANVVIMPNNKTTLVIFGKTAGNVLPWGSLSGGDSGSWICGSGSSGGNGGQPTIFAIGSLNTSTTNGSQIIDANVGIQKVGTGTLTLTNNNMKYTGETVVSNGVLAFVPLGTNVYDYPNTASYFEGTNFTIVAPGILDVTGASTNAELYLGHNGFAQSLFGSGTLNGNLMTASNSVYIAPAKRANNGNLYSGSTLTINGNAIINFSSTLMMTINATNTPAYDSLAALGPNGLAINSARLTVSSVGSTAFANGSSNVFYFFPGAHIPVNPIGGASTIGITNITLPAIANCYWVTNLTLDGSMAIVNTNSALNVNPPNVQVSVGSAGGNQTLTLGWPNNLGWILQAQTNDSNMGLTPSSNWVDVPGSALITNTVITVDPKQPAVFYRMRNPSAPAE